MQILTPGLQQIYRFCLRFRGPQSEDRVTDKVTDKVTGLTEPFFLSMTSTMSAPRINRSEI